MSIRTPSVLTVLHNAMVTWNTLHIGHVVEQLRAEGHTSDDTTLSLTTPLLRKHINPLGNIISIWSVIAKPQIRRRAKRLKPLTEVFGWMWPVRAGTLLGDEFRIEAGEEKEFLTLLREWKAASPFLARIVLIDLN